VRVEDNIPDAGIGFVYNVVSPIGFVPQTIVVEGITRTRRAGAEVAR
jgi:hypothetical protein